jgi:hypothetical protein
MGSFDKTIVEMSDKDLRRKNKSCRTLSCGFVGGSRTNPHQKLLKGARLLMDFAENSLNMIDREKFEVV